MLTRRKFLSAASSALVFPRSTIAFGSDPTSDNLDQIARVKPRDSWGKDHPPLAKSVVEDVRFLLVHHSASANDYREEDVTSLLQGFFEYHTSPKKDWSDIAYNFLVDRFGVIWEGRAGSVDGPVAGDATGGNQGFSQLVCVIGDFSIKPPTPAATKALASLLTRLAITYNISTEVGAKVRFVSRGSNRWPAGDEVITRPIAGHREMSLTSCPGDALYPYVSNDLVAEVEARRHQVGIERVSWPPRPGRRF